MTGSPIRVGSAIAIDLMGSVAPSKASRDAFSEGEMSFVFGRPSPKFHKPRTPSRALSVEARPSIEYLPVSYWRCARTDAGGGPEFVGGVEMDLLLREIERRVCESIR